MSSDQHPPKFGSMWSHVNGSTYLVYDLTNIDSVRENFPPSVSYLDMKTGVRYSRTLADWKDSVDKGNRLFAGTAPSSVLISHLLNQVTIVLNPIPVKKNA
jgi:hypothetical protein